MTLGEFFTAAFDVTKRARLAGRRPIGIVLGKDADEVTTEATKTLTGKNQLREEALKYSTPRALSQLWDLEWQRALDEELNGVACIGIPAGEIEEIFSEDLGNIN